MAPKNLNKMGQQDREKIRLENEWKMKSKGETKIHNTIKSKTGKYKQVAQTQIGQQIILDESLRVLPELRDWIDNTSARGYRRALKGYFKDDNILLEKTASTYLLLAGTIYNEPEVQKNRDTKSRHKKVNTIKSKVVPELSFEVAWRFLEVAIELSDYFGIEKAPVYDGNGFSWSFKYTCMLSDEILSKISYDAINSFYPMPIFEPPADWRYENGEIIGGYHTYQYEMVRANRTIDYSLYSQRIFNSINYIQSTPWRVNEDLLKQVSADLVAPVKSDYVKGIFPDAKGCCFELSKEELKELPDEERIEIEKRRSEFRELAELYSAELDDFKSAVGKYRAKLMAVQIAEEYKGKVIYFPHSFDFRGRIYPIPVGLSPQGSDAIKALLEYAEGEELTKAGEDWCWAYMASLWGDDKIEFEDRIKRGKELINADYHEADEPYQFLAHQLEMKKYLANPQYKVKARIHLDACNSGSQFTSAITGDKAGCIATNVIPTINEDGSHTRQDAYILVADKALTLTQKYIETAEAEKRDAAIFFEGLLKANGRKICKTPVMVSNYGGTSGGRAEILWDMLRELGCERKWITKKNASLFSTLVGNSISGVLNGGKAFETYIHRMNNLVAKTNKPIWWTTGDGFHVVHVKNKELKSKQVSCLLPGSRRKTTIIKKQYSDDVSIPKMKSAISPNYIHSLDAELLRRVALKMKAQGIKYSDWIHDSFGCHPNYVDEMLYITKCEFSKLVKRSPLKILHKELSSQVKKTKANQKALERIKMPYLRGFNVSAGDLDVVMDSNWFFS